MRHTRQTVKPIAEPANCAYRLQLAASSVLVDPPAG